MTKKKNKKLINVLQFAGFGFPALFIWMSVVIIPFIYGIWITFTDWNGLAMHINYVGLQNYIDVFKDAGGMGSGAAVALVGVDAPFIEHQNLTGL